MPACHVTVSFIVGYYGIGLDSILRSRQQRKQTSYIAATAVGATLVALMSHAWHRYQLFTQGLPGLNACCAHNQSMTMMGAMAPTSGMYFAALTLSWLLATCLGVLTLALRKCSCSSESL
jgi:hypothetical protein